MSILRKSLLCLFILATGCAADTRSRSPEEDFGDEFVRVGCELTRGCRFGADQQVRLIYRNQQDCETWLHRRVDARFAAIHEAVAAGQMAFDPAEAELCLTRLAGSCGIGEPEEPEDALRGHCRAVFDGGVILGQPCNETIECEGDSFCLSSRTEGLCEGVCAARSEPGAECDSRHECSGTYGACVRGQCTELPPGGEAQSGERCQATPTHHDVPQCGAGLFCMPSTLGDAGDSVDDGDVWRCRSELSLEEPCREASVCVEGALCVRQPEGERRCEVLRVQRLGEPCGSHPLEWCDGIAGLQCADGLCEAAPLGRAGDRCEREIHSCQVGLECLFDPTALYSTCQALVDLGEPAESRRACASGRLQDGPCVPQYCQP